MRTIAILVGVCLASAVSAAAAGVGVHQGEKDLFPRGDGEAAGRAVAGKVQKDGALDICIGKNEANAIRCLHKFGYLGSGAKDASLDGLEGGGGADSGGEDVSAPAGHRRGLLMNPGQRIRQPVFQTQDGGGPSSGGAGTPGIGMPGDERSGGAGINAGAADKAPPPGKKRKR